MLGGGDHAVCVGGQNTFLGLDILIATHSLVLNSFLPLKKKKKKEASQSPAGSFHLSRIVPGHFGLEVELYPLVAYLIYTCSLVSKVSGAAPKSKRILTVHDTGA